MTVLRNDGPRSGRGLRELQFTEIGTAERARLREHLKPVYEKYARTLGEDVVRATLAEVEKAHGTAAR